MISAPTHSEGQSREQALAANVGDVRCIQKAAVALFIGFGYIRRTTATPIVDFASRRSSVRSRLAPLANYLQTKGF